MNPLDHFSTGGPNMTTGASWENPFSATAGAKPILVSDFRNVAGPPTWLWAARRFWASASTPSRSESEPGTVPVRLTAESIAPVDLANVVGEHPLSAVLVVTDKQSLEDCIGHLLDSGLAGGIATSGRTRPPDWIPRHQSRTLVAFAGYDLTVQQRCVLGELFGCILIRCPEQMPSWTSLIRRHFFGPVVGNPRGDLQR